MDPPIDKLVTDLRSSSAATRSEAAERLCRLGPEARYAAVPLVKATADAEESVRQWATAALEEMGPPLASDCATLAGMTDDANGDVAYWAITLLGRLGAHAAAATGVIVRPLREHPARHVKQRAAWALGHLGNRDTAVLDALEAASRSDDVRLARLAQAAMRRLRR